MGQERCSCGGNPEAMCPRCGGGTPLPYWCETCEKLVPEKRCPGCGLKARKVRQPGTSTEP